MSDTASLFVPSQYVAEDPAAIVRRYPFALLITSGEGGIFATSIPIFFAKDGSTEAMVGHLARRNPHASALRDGANVLAVFSGPHAYISASWYREKPEVPTWDYVAAHVRGTIHPIDEPDRNLAILEYTVSAMEADSERPWTLQHATQGRVDALLPHIRSFEIRVSRIKGVTKLSQSHPPGDRTNVVEKLMAKNGTGDAAEIARMISELDVIQ